MARIPLIETREDAPPAAAPVVDRIVASRGEVLRPFAVLLHRPELAEKIADVGAELRFASLLPPRVRELAILATARANDSGFEWNLHRGIAESVGVVPPDVEAARSLRSDDLGDDQSGAVIRFVGELTSGGVSDATFADALARLGTESVVELSALVGYYTMLAYVMNACIPDAGIDEVER